MSGETVFRELKIQFLHEAVAVNLRNDGSGGNGKQAAVTANNSSERKSRVMECVAVNEDVARWRSETLQRSVHGADGCLKDVQRINLVCFRDTDTNLKSAFENPLAQYFASSLCQDLGVGDSQDIYVGRKYHGCRDHRTSERPAARFIHTGQRTEPFDEYSFFCG